MNVYLPNLRLPSAYQEVEYIQSTGTQYINTGYIPNNNTKVELSMGGWTYVQQYAHLFGIRAAWSATDASVGRGFFLCHQYNSSYIGMFGRGYSSSSGGWSSTTFSFANGNNHIVEMSQSGAYEDGTLKASLQTVTFTSPSNMCIFALNDNGTVKENSSYKLYYFKIWNNGTLVRDFVPCYRKSDNVIGLYDLVNSVFYTNSGTGTFSKGNDVTMAELKNAYIGEVYEYSYDFRNKSSTILTNDGWTFPDGTTSLGFDSNGMYNSSTSRRWAVRSIDLSNARKITYTANTIQVSTKNVGMRLASDNTGSTSNSIGFAATDSTIYWVLFGDNTASANPTGNIQGKIIADLENKSLVMYDGSYSKSFTLTDANVTKIRGLSYLLVCAFKSGNYIQDINIVIEY